jgi:monomeric isocitrate dehydrogenase
VFVLDNERNEERHIVRVCSTVSKTIDKFQHKIDLSNERAQNGVTGVVFWLRTIRERERERK